MAQSDAPEEVLDPNQHPVSHLLDPSAEANDLLRAYELDVSGYIVKPRRI
jgi:hypothetical protein